MAYLNTRPLNNWNLHGTYHTIAPYAGEYLEEIPDDIPLIDALSYAGVLGIVTSAYRPNAVAKATNRPSRHRLLDKNGYPMTLDIQPMGGRGGDFGILKNMLLDPRLQRWFARNGYGVIDETIPANMRKNGATGPHYHIGLDSGALREYSAWVKAFNPSADQVDPSVIYSHPVLQIPFRPLNTLPDNYVPGTDPKWDMYLGARKAAAALGEDIQEPSPVILPPPQMHLPNIAALASLIPKPESDAEKFMLYTKALAGQDYLNRALAAGGHLYDGASEDTLYLRNYKLMPVEEVPNMSEIPLVDFESGENLGVATPGLKVWTLNGAPVMTSDERGRADLALLTGRDPSFFGRELDNIDVTPAGTRLNRYRTLLENMENARTALDNELQQYYNNQFAANDLIRLRNDLVKADREAHERTKGLSELAATMALGLPALGTAAIAVPTMYAATAGTTAGNLIGGLAGFEALNKTGETLTGTTWADALQNSTGIKPEVGEWLNPLMFANVERAFTKPGVNAMENLTDLAINYMFRNNPSTTSRMINLLGNMYVPNWDYTRTNIGNAINTGVSAAKGLTPTYFNTVGKRVLRGEYNLARKKWKRYTTSLNNRLKLGRDLQDRWRHLVGLLIARRQAAFDRNIDLRGEAQLGDPLYYMLSRLLLGMPTQYGKLGDIDIINDIVAGMEPTKVSDLNAPLINYDPITKSFTVPRPTTSNSWPTQATVTTKFGTVSSPIPQSQAVGTNELSIPWTPSYLLLDRSRMDWPTDESGSVLYTARYSPIIYPGGSIVSAPPYFSIENPVRLAALLYVDDLSTRIGDNGLVVGSFKRVALGETHSPHDVEFLTTEARVKALDKILGVTSRLKIPAGYTVTSEEFSHLPAGTADYLIIKEGPHGKATGKVAWQRYQYLHPEEAQRLQELIIEKRKKNIGTGDYFEEELPITPEELLTELRTTLVGDRSVEIDLMGNRKTKATEHKILLLLSGDPQRVKEMLDVKLKSNIPNALTLEELFPNISFDNIEANKAFLRAAGYSEEYATDPKVMRNIVANYLYTKQIFSRGTNFTKARLGSDAFISKPVKEQINLESRGNTSYGGGDASGLGKNSVEPRPEETAPTTGAIFSDTAFLYLSPITYNPEKIQTPEDIIKQLEYIRTNSANLNQAIKLIGRGAGVEDAVEAAARAQDIPFLMTPGYSGLYRGILTRDIPYGYRYVAGQNQGGFETFSVPPLQLPIMVQPYAEYSIPISSVVDLAELRGFNAGKYRELKKQIATADRISREEQKYLRQLEDLLKQIDNLLSKYYDSPKISHPLSSISPEIESFIKGVVGPTLITTGGVTLLNSYIIEKLVKDEVKYLMKNKPIFTNNKATMEDIDKEVQLLSTIVDLPLEDVREEVLRQLEDNLQFQYWKYLKELGVPISKSLSRRLERWHKNKL